MKAVFGRGAAIAVVLLGIALLIAGNQGLISSSRRYVYRVLEQRAGELLPVAFEHVHVIPMDTERILEDQTVLIRYGSIERIGPSAEIQIPADAARVDGSGQYLIPGLTDMHVHIEDENDLLVYVANGVTTVRNLWGNTEKKSAFGVPDQLVLREQISRGELFGPTIYTAGPIMEGQPASHPLMSVFRTPEQAAESVAWQAEQGYDFIKVYDHLSLPVYQAVTEAAGAAGLPVVGHVPSQVGLEAALAAGQSTIEHLSGYIDPDSGTFIIPEERIEYYAELTRQAGVWNVPTIRIYQNTVPPDQIERLEAQPGAQYISPLMRVLMRLFIGQLSDLLTYEGDDYQAHIRGMYLRMTSALHEAGAGIVLGTDATNSYLIPGYSLLDEAAYLVEAGFTPYEALVAGIRSPAEAMGALDEFGTIEPGKRADLVLLNNNPLEDIGALRSRSGVMLQGRWLPQATLQLMLDDLERSYVPTLVERVWPLAVIGLGAFLLRREFSRAGRG